MVDGRIVSDVVVSEAAAICEFLRCVPLFSGLASNKLTEVADKMTFEHFKVGETLLRQGESGDRFYLIRRGEAKCRSSKTASCGSWQRSTKGQYFGERALLTGEPRNATVREDGNGYLLAARGRFSSHRRGQSDLRRRITPHSVRASILNEIVLVRFVGQNVEATLRAGERRHERRRSEKRAGSRAGRRRFTRNCGFRFENGDLLQIGPRRRTRGVRQILGK